MYAFILRRILYSAPIALGVTLVCFCLVHLAPGDPLSTVLPDNATPEVAAQIRAAYGFDRPLAIQYFIWLSNVATGDLGVSIQSRRPVLNEVLPAVGNTLLLALFASIIGFLAGVVLGALAGFRQGATVDRVVTAFAVTGVSVPHYWLGMVFVVVFSVNLGWLPAVGMGSGDAIFSVETMRHMILPVITLSLIPAGIIARSVRATVAEVSRREFVETLHAKGMPRSAIVNHVAKNAAPTILAVTGLQLAQLLGGSILVETVFSWPGAGYLLNGAIFTRDLPLLQGTILVLALFFVFTNLVVDVLQTLLDPRMARS